MMNSPSITFDPPQSNNLTVLEVIQEDVETLALNTVLLNDDAGAANDLAGVALPVDFAETSPGAEDLSVTDFDQVDLVFGAESFDELDVFGLGAGLDENAQVSLALIEGLGALAETTSETIVDESVLQDLLLGKCVMGICAYSRSRMTRT